MRAAEPSQASYQSGKNLHQICKRQDNIEFKVEWEGLANTIDFAWEPLSILYEDVPAMVTEYLLSPGEERLKEKAIVQSSFDCPTSKVEGQGAL